MIPTFDREYLQRIAEPNTWEPGEVIEVHHLVDSRAACGGSGLASASWRCVNCEACRASA